MKHVRIAYNNIWEALDEIAAMQAREIIATLDRQLTDYGIVYEVSYDIEDISAEEFYSR